MQGRTCCSAIVITKLFHAHKEIQETVSNHNTVLFARIRLRDFYLTRPFVTQSFVFWQMYFLCAETFSLLRTFHTC